MEYSCLCEYLWFLFLIVAMLCFLFQLSVATSSYHSQFPRGSLGNRRLCALWEKLASCPGWEEKVRPWGAGVCPAAQPLPRIPPEERLLLGDSGDLFWDHNLWSIGFSFLLSLRVWLMGLYLFQRQLSLGKHLLNTTSTCLKAFTFSHYTRCAVKEWMLCDGHLKESLIFLPWVVKMKTQICFTFLV